MNFSQLDPTLRTWATRHGLTLSTQYQDSEVRSFELAGPAGRAQLWLETNGAIVVQVWDYRKRRQSYATDLGALETSLEAALALAKQWCGLP